MALEPVPSIPPLVVVAHHDPGTADSLRHAVEAAGWQVLLADPSVPALATALAAGPSAALVGCAALTNLPPDCSTPLVAVGDDDRPADIKAALVAGARSLLAWPDGAADLPGELARVAATGLPDAAMAPGPGSLVVATRGVQGGAGTTTVAIHLAAAWSRWGPAPVLLLDLVGGLAFRLDLGAAPTWSTLVPPAAVAAVGLDADTLVGTVAEPWAGLSVMPLAGLADGAPDPPPEPSVVRSVLEVAATVYRVVVVDLPTADGPVVETVLSRADALVAVGRCETAGVRALQAALAAWAGAGRDPDAAGAVVTGVRPRAPLAPREVRSALGDHLWSLVPAAGAELAAAAEDGVLLLDRHDLSAVQAMVTLANRVVPFATVPA